MDLRKAKKNDSPGEAGGWPLGGGEAGALIRSRDWSRTPLGPVERWPQNLRTAVDIMLGSPAPTSVMWGPEHVQLYNDAYIGIAQERHPAIFGRPALENWADARDFLGPIFRGILAGGPPVVVQDRSIPLRRADGTTEERAFTATFSAIPDESGAVGGIFHPLQETTAAARAVEALRESEDRLRLTLAAADLGIWEHDHLAGEIRLDARAQALYGLGPVVPLDEVVRRVHPDDRERLAREMGAALDPAVRAPVATEYRVVHPDGDVRWLRVQGRVYFAGAGPGGPPVRGLGTVQDVTDHKRAEAAVRESEARQAFLLRLSDRLRPLVDPVEIQYVAARALGEHLGASRVGYAEAQEDDETIVVTRNYTDGVPGIEGRYRYDEYGPELLREFRAGRTVVRPDVAGDPSLTEAEKAAHAALQLGATVNVPLVKAGKLVAVLFLHHREAHAYTADELSLLEAVAERTWDAVERARAEAALRDNEERLRLALDVAGLGTWTWDLATGTGDIDARGGEIVGLRPGRLENVPEAQRARVHPDDLARLEAALRAGIASGDAFTLAYRAVHPDGSVHHVASRARVLTDEAGRPVRLVGTNRDVTAEREAEAALRESETRLRESEARYRALFASMDEGFCVLQLIFDEAGRPVDYRYLEINPAFERQTGMRDALGRTVRELVPAIEPFWADVYGRVALTGEPTRFESHAASMGRWFDVNAFRIGEPHERRVAVLFSDITARKRAEEDRERLLWQAQAARKEAEAAHEQLGRVFEHAPACIATLRGPDHVFEMANPLYRRLVGDRELIGKPAREAVPELVEQGYIGLLDHAYRTGRPHAMTEARVLIQHSPEGGLEEFFFNFVYQPLTDPAGAVAGILAYGADVTVQVRARREIEAARAEAEAANRAKSEFLAVMSHELRTPLNAIGGYAELMEMGIRGPVTEQQRADLHRIQQSQRHLLGLINEVLNYARLESGAVAFDLEDVSVRDALAAAAALVAPQAGARGLTLNVEPCPPDLQVRADPDKLRQILLNLLSNAVKFTDRGGRVELACEASDDRVHVCVRDTGIGIPADQLERIFEPFVQVRADLTRTAEGTGLGLAISRDLARGMAGDLTAESTPGVGSTFTLTLPRAREE